MVNYQGRKYSIEKYNPDWETQFEKEKEVLQCIFEKEVIGIEHIGSTAIPNLGGKPTIDILVIVKDLKNIDSFAPYMMKSGYLDKGEYVTKNSRLFVREKRVKG